MLARPDDKGGDLLGVKYKARSEQLCGPEVCVHFVRSTQDAPPYPDEKIPPQVQLTVDVLAEVWTAVVDEAGYRAPLPDDDSENGGPDGRLDVYLADIGSIGAGYYGFCNSDDPEATESAHPKVSAYCVLDDDFATGQFGGDPQTSLEVTAAHEFFHAVQFAYDYWEDLWFMEGTAAWAEDEVYDQINDNLMYLNRSALSAPNAPLDFFGPGHPDDPYGFAWSYGSWIWWRYLSEYFGPRASHDPTVIKQVWGRLGSGEGTLQAQRNVLRNRGTTFGDVFADFTAVNRVARRWYDEGGSYGKFVAPVKRKLVLTKASPGTGWKKPSLHHLSTVHTVVRAGKSLRGKWRLRVSLDLPPKHRGSRAKVAVHRRDGRIGWRAVRLDRRGDARVTVPFNRRRVSFVALSLTNASTRMRDCGFQTLTSPYACGGWSRDDGQVFKFKVTAIR